MGDKSTTASESVALYERHGNVAVITLNRPRPMNAVNRALSTAVATLPVRAACDDKARVIVITGADPAFCADAKEGPAAFAEQREPVWQGC